MTLWCMYVWGLGGRFQNRENGILWYVLGTLCLYRGLHLAQKRLPVFFGPFPDVTCRWPPSGDKYKVLTRVLFLKSLALQGPAPPGTRCVPGSAGQGTSGRPTAVDAILPAIIIHTDESLGLLLVLQVYSVQSVNKHVQAKVYSSSRRREARSLLVSYIFTTYMQKKTHSSERRMRHEA